MKPIPIQQSGFWRVASGDNAKIMNITKKRPKGPSFVSLIAPGSA
jgi:hypothetical protein